MGRQRAVACHCPDRRALAHHRDPALHPRARPHSAADAELMAALLTFLHREMKGASARIVAALLIAGLSRGALLAIFNTGVAKAAGHTLAWQIPTAFFGV